MPLPNGLPIKFQAECDTEDPDACTDRDTMWEVARVALYSTNDLIAPKFYCTKFTQEDVDRYYRGLQNRYAESLVNGNNPTTTTPGMFKVQT